MCGPPEQAAGVLVCSRCKVSRYCSKRCQKAAWKDDYTGAGHKLGCDTYLENLRPGGVPADQGKCAAICMAGSCWLDPEEELDDALAQREAYFFADPDVPQVLHLIISCTNALGAVRMGITATLGRAGTIYHAMDLVYAAIDEGPRAEAMLDSWTLARGGGLSSAARTRALDTILQFAQRAAAAGRGGCFCGVCLGRGMTWLLDEPTFLPRARSAGLSQLMSPHVGQDHIMDAMSPAAIMASMMAEQESPGGHLAAAAPSAAMAETAHGAADELLVAVGNIREANPNMGIKKVVAAVKAANPAWSVGAKEVREALKTLADNPSALRAVAAATADDQQQTEIERLMRLQLGPAGGMSAGASAAGPSPLHGRGLPTTAEAAAAARHERAQELDTKAAAGAWQYNQPCAQQYVDKYQSCMVISGRLISHAPVCQEQQQQSSWDQSQDRQQHRRRCTETSASVVARSSCRLLRIAKARRLRYIGG